MNEKSLIIYFSRKGNNYSTQGIKYIEIGNTEVIAKYIKEFTNADLFKVETVKDYPEDYMECTQVAQEEIDSNTRPELKEYLKILVNMILYISDVQIGGVECH